MPIPSLPIEIVSEIVSHLRSPPPGPEEPPSALIDVAIDDGKAVSLVCRSWYPVGQALRWKDLRLDLSSISSLFAHFTVHPKLAMLVRTLEQVLEMDKSSRDQETAQQSFARLARLLSSTVDLVRLDCTTPRGADPRAVLLAASCLPRLQDLVVNYKGGIVWTNELHSIFAAGFPNLLECTIRTRKMQTVEDETVTLVSPTTLKNLHELSLRWTSPLSTAGLVQSFISCINPSRLKRCDLWGSPANVSTLEWLSNCSQLTDFTIFPSTETFASVCVNLLSRLPANPARLGQFAMRTTIFVGWEAFEAIPSTGLYRTIEGLLQTTEGNRPAMLWRAEEGPAEWKRFPKLWKTWDEYDTCPSLA